MRNIKKIINAKTTRNNVKTDIIKKPTNNLHNSLHKNEIAASIEKIYDYDEMSVNIAMKIII